MIIFLYGSDTFRSRQKLEEIKKKFLSKDGNASLNFSSFVGDKAAFDEFAGAVRSSPFLSDKRLIIAELFLQKKSAMPEKDLLTIIESLPETTVLVFWEGEIAARERGKIFKRLQDEKYAEEFLPLTGGKLLEWIKKEAALFGVGIESAAARVLSEGVGGDLWRLNKELGKLASYAKSFKEKSISAQAVRELVDFEPEEKLFPLMDAILARDARNSLTLLKNEIARGEPPLIILSLLARQTRIAISVKDSLTRGERLASVASLLKVPPFVIEKTARVLGQVSLDKLKSFHAAIAAADSGIKTGARGDEAALELLVLRACAG